MTLKLNLLLRTITINMFTHFFIYIHLVHHILYFHSMQINYCYHKILITSLQLFNYYFNYFFFNSFHVKVIAYYVIFRSCKLFRTNSCIKFTFNNSLSLSILFMKSDNLLESLKLRQLGINKINPFLLLNNILGNISSEQLKLFLNLQFKLIPRKYPPIGLPKTFPLTARI